jgi:hypothetical protein
LQIELFYYYNVQIILNLLLTIYSGGPEKSRARSKIQLRALLDFMIIYMLQILKNNYELKPTKRAFQQ